MHVRSLPREHFYQRGQWLAIAATRGAPTSCPDSILIGFVLSFGNRGTRSHDVEPNIFPAAEHVDTRDLGRNVEVSELKANEPRHGKGRLRTSRSLGGSFRAFSGGLDLAEQTNEAASAFRLQRLSTNKKASRL